MEENKCYIRIYYTTASITPDEDRIIILIQDNYSYGYSTIDEDKENIINEINEYLKDDKIHGICFMCSKFNKDFYESIKVIKEESDISKYENKDIWLSCKEQSIENILGAFANKNSDDTLSVELSFLNDISVIMDSNVEPRSINRRRMIDCAASMAYINENKKLPKVWPLMEKYFKNE